MVRIPSSFGWGGGGGEENQYPQTTINELVKAFLRCYRVEGGGWTLLIPHSRSGGWRVEGGGVWFLFFIFLHYWLGPRAA